MRPGGLSGAAVIAAVIGVCVGCTVELPLIENPSTPLTWPTPITTGEPSRTERPKALDLTRQSDCSALSDLPVTRWSVQPGRPFFNEAAFKNRGYVACSWGRSEPPFGLLITLNPNLDLAQHPVRPDALVKETTARGYPMIITYLTKFPRGVNPACDAAIDVADGQLVTISYGINGEDDPSVGLEDLCDTLPDVAAQVLIRLDS